MRYQEELSQVKWKKNMQMQIVMHCGPVFAGIKPSNTVTLDFHDSRKLMETFRGSGIKCALIYAGSQKCLWLLYREQEVQEYLMKPGHRKFLKDCGYSSFQLKDILHALRERYHLYKTKQQEFPHELGLILGYPLCDVTGFIEYQGRNYLYSGYWKIYENLEETRKLFDLYDHIRYYMVKQVEYGKSLEQLMEAYGRRQVPNYA